MDPASITATVGKLALGKGLGAALSQIVSYHKSSCREKFIERLAQGDEPFDPEILKTKDEFVYYYAITEAAVERASRDQKIWVLANMLKSALYYGRLSHEAEYEDYLKIIDDLSIREMVLLFILQKYEEAHPQQEGENYTQRATRFWRDFVKEATARFGISEDEMTAMLVRTLRSGCYDYNQGGWGGNNLKAGRLTPIYYKLVKLIAEEREALLQAGERTYGSGSPPSSSTF